MFPGFFLKSFRILLLPFSLIYWLGIFIRNKMYDRGILKSSSFGLPLICVGNLTTGGTGKSPMVELLLEHLKNDWKVATLSRGYKRKTRGYVLADTHTTALEIGDEPMLFHIKFPAIPVAVGEKRLEAIPQLMQDKPDTEVIILDDAFQHREIRAGLNILLTDYNNLFTNDFYLPTGDLRDLKSSYRRAEIIVVTKCIPDLSVEEKNRLLTRIRPLPGQAVFFTALAYSDTQHIKVNRSSAISDKKDVLLVTGIANPKPLQQLLEAHSRTYYFMQFPDHHIFTIDDLHAIRKKFDSIQSTSKMILTTEKDRVRLMKFEDEINKLPLYVIPVQHEFLFGEEEQFMTRVRDFIVQFKKPV